MGALWDDDLYLLTPEELAKCPPWLLLTNINGGQAERLDSLDPDEMDLRYGVTAWGVAPVEYEVYGEIVIKHDWTAEPFDGKTTKRKK
jgi:hypothetical protein